MPALRRNDHFGFTAGLEQLFVQAHGVVQHDLVTAYKEQGRGHAFQFCEEGGPGMTLW